MVRQSPSVPLVEVDGLCVSFGDKRVLDGFSLSLPAAGRLILAGPSGCGKSSVLRAILGFLRPGAGAIRIDGEQLSPQSVWRLRRRMSFVPQEPDLGDSTAGEWIDELLSLRANSEVRDNSGELDVMLHDVGLTRTHLAQKGGELSGGEKQRIALVGALLLDRDLMLLDEPTSALDHETRELVYHCLTRRGRAMIIVSHDVPPQSNLQADIIRMKPFTQENKDGRD